MSSENLVDRLLASITKEASMPLNVTDPETTQEIEVTDHDEGTASGEAVPQLGGVTKANIFRHPDAHPIVLDFLLLQKYEISWLEWDPEVLYLAIPRDFGSELSTANYQKINAIKSLHLVDAYWERWEVFLWCTMGLNGIAPNLNIMQVPTVAQVLVGMDIANRVRDDVEWTQEIRSFILAVYEHDGILFSIPPADIVVPATQDLLVDAKEIGEKWPHVRATNRAPSDESIVSEQLRRLLVASSYLEDSRERLRHQLRLISHV